MKKIMEVVKRVLGFVFAFCMLCGFAECVDLGKPVLSEDESFNVKVSSNLNREEHRRTIKYEYGGKLNSNPYKYISVKNVISYVNRITKEVLAEFTVVMKFRYNENTQRAECLSTSYGSIAKDTDYSVNVSARKANNTTDQGAGIADVEFKYRGERQDAFSRQISCDCFGGISIFDC